MNYIREKNRIYAVDEQNNTIAEVTYRHIDETTIAVDHTFVDTSLRGKGIANELMLEIVKLLKEKNWKAVPTCSYAVKWSQDEKNDHALFLQQ